MVPRGEDYHFVKIREKRKEVEVGDLLGFTLRSAGNVECDEVGGFEHFIHRVAGARVAQRQFG